MTKKTQDSREKKLSCQGCGQHFVLFPPDDSFKHLLIKPCSDNEGDPNHNYKQIFQCDNCHFRHEFYWCPGHVFIESVGSDVGYRSDEYELNRRREMDNIL